MSRAHRPFRLVPGGLQAVPILAVLFAVLMALVLPLRASDGADWPPISPADRASTSFSAQPGASAVILERTIDCDNRKDFEVHFNRVKILTEAGRSEASVRIGYDASEQKITGIEARTIEPDGTVIPFHGQVFDSVLAAVRGLRYRVKSFSLPEVRVGSIIDYRYRVVWRRSFPVLTEWRVQSNLFVLHEKFTVIPLKGIFISWISRGLDHQHQPVRQKTPDDVISLEQSNVAPIADEPWSLPREERVQAVTFFYSFDMLRNPATFWKQFGTSLAEFVNQYIGKPKNVEPWMTAFAKTGGSPENKLRAIYSYTVSLRNLSVESLEAGDRDDTKKRKQNKSVKDVLKHQYGSPDEITLAFVALAWAAGFNAWHVLASSRDHQFFTKIVTDEKQLDGSLAEVIVGGNEEFFDPGDRCPYGVIPWVWTGVTGLRLDDKGGTFITTAPPSASQASVMRAGSFLLLADGTLQGQLTVNFGGDEAYARNLAALSLDTAGRVRKLTDEVRTWFPKNSTVQLTRVNGWDTTEPVLTAVFTINVPNFAVSAGARLLFPQGVLQAISPQQFPSPHRQGPIYFHEPLRIVDDVRIDLPKGVRIESVPHAAATAAHSSLHYHASISAVSSSLQWRREYAVDHILYTVATYPQVRAFFGAVRQNDHRQVVLERKPAEAQASR